MIKKVFAGLLFLTSIEQAAGQKQSFTDSFLVNAICGQEISLFYSTKKFDARFVKLFKKSDETSLAMVEPNQLYNISCYVIKGFPKKRLIVFGKGGLKTNLILFEAWYSIDNAYCIIYRKEKRRRYRFILIHLDKHVNNLEELKQSILDKRYAVSFDNFEDTAHLPL